MRQKLRAEREWGRAKSRDKREKYKHLVCQEGTGHISRLSQCVSSFVATTTLGGCSYVNPPPQAVRWSAMTHGPGCEKEEGPLVPSAYIIFLMGRPWVSNRRNNDVLGRSEQLLHGGGDGAGREQQPAGLLPTRGTDVQTDSRAITCSECNLKSPEISTHILLSGCWSNYSPFNLRLFRLRRSHFQSSSLHCNSMLNVIIIRLSQWLRYNFTCADP